MKLDKCNYSVYFKFSSYLESFYIFSYLDNIGITSKLINETKYAYASKMLKKCSNWWKWYLIVLNGKSIEIISKK